MNFTKSTGLVFLGLLITTSGTYAQVNENIIPQPETTSGSSANAYDALLRNAETLMKSGKPGEAYRLLEPFEFEHAGKVRFDYLIGIAALDSGKPDMATLALERVLSVNPDHVSARLDIARAYYQLGDFPRARTEFTAVLKQKPTDSVRTSIEKYLDSIASQEDDKRQNFSGYIEVAGGSDSNVNSSTSQTQVNAFYGTNWVNRPLDEVNIQVSDNYYAIAAGGKVVHNLNSRLGLFLGADYKKRGNNTYTQFDSVNKEERAGIVYETRTNRLHASVLASQYEEDGKKQFNTTGLKGEWRHVFSPSNQFNLLAQSVRYRYVDPLMKPNDIDQQALGLGWLHGLPDGQSSFSGSFYYGTEKDVSPVIQLPDPNFIGSYYSPNPNGGRNDGTKKFSGLRIGGQTNFSDRTTIFVIGGYQAANYDKNNHLFLRKRKDQMYEFKLGANWNLDKLWILRPQVSYIKNNSNIEIYGYDRMDVSLTVRRDFR